jgi:hypothetical protein
LIKLDRALSSILPNAILESERINSPVVKSPTDWDGAYNCHPLAPDVVNTNSYALGDSLRELTSHLIFAESWENTGRTKARNRAVKISLMVIDMGKNKRVPEIKNPSLNA